MQPLLPADSRLDHSLLRAWAMPDDTTDDKLGRGTVLVIAGCAHTPGAAILSGVAALRVGAGRLQIATAPSIAPAIGVAVPEALVTAADPQSSKLTELCAVADTIVVGPGLDDEVDVGGLLQLALAGSRSNCVIVIDAAALKALNAARPSTCRQLVLTPNDDELALLKGDRQSVDAERAVAAAMSATVVSAGRVAAMTGESWIDGTTVRGLGTSGSGDVLAGAVGGLAARCGNGPQAACWAAYIHRLAASRLSHRVGPIGYLARELVDELAPALALASG